DEQGSAGEGEGPDVLSLGLIVVDELSAGFDTVDFGLRRRSRVDRAVWTHRDSGDLLFRQRGESRNLSFRRDTQNLARLPSGKIGGSALAWRAGVDRGLVNPFHASRVARERQRSVHGHGAPASLARGKVRGGFGNPDLGARGAGRGCQGERARRQRSELQGTE